MRLKHSTGISKDDAIGSVTELAPRGMFRFDFDCGNWGLYEYYETGLFEPIDPVEPQETELDRLRKAAAPFANFARLTLMLSNQTEPDRKLMVANDFAITVEDCNRLIEAMKEYSS